MQLIIVYILVLVAAAYAIIKAYKAIRTAGDSCAGCSGCAMKKSPQEDKMKNCQKKTQEKFGGNK